MTERLMSITLRFLTAFLVAGIVTSTLSVHAQPAKKPARIGILSPFNRSADAFRDAFQQRMQELGYIAGRNLTLEYRASEGMADRLPQLAIDLAKMKLDAIVTTTAPGVQAARQATRMVPIIM